MIVLALVASKAGAGAGAGDSEDIERTAEADSSAVILCESYDQEYQRFISAAEAVLQRIPTGTTRLSYSYEHWLFHYFRDGDVVYLCTADGEMGRRLPFAFLSEIQKKFSSTFAPALLDSPDPRDFNSFTATLSAMRKKFNTEPQSDPVRAAQAELAGVKDIMTQNVEQILNRGERLDNLMNRTDQAAHQSLAFRRRAVGLRRQMWYKNAKVTAMAGFCAVVMIFILVAALK